LLLFPNLKRHVANIGSETDNGTNAVIRVAIQVVDNIASRVVLGSIGCPIQVPWMRVQIDQSGHHGFTRQIDLNPTSWEFKFPFFPDPSKSFILDDKRRILEKPTIANDQTSAFE